MRPRSVGSFFTSRSSERAKLRASASSRSTSSRVRSAIEIRCRARRSCGGRSSSRRTGCQPSAFLLGVGTSRTRSTSSTSTSCTWMRSSARGREVLADVVGADRELAVAAVDEARRAGRARDGRSRRAPRSRRGSCGRCRGRRRRGRTSCPRAGSRASSRGRPAARGAAPRRLARRTSSRWKVMSTEPSATSSAGELLDQAPEPLRERDAARVDADERDLVEVGVAAR